MPGRITPSQRKRMLRLHRDGATYAEIMKSFGIWDQRTMKRHLELAEEEERTERVRRRRLEDATAEHMAEIRELIIKWKDSIKLDAFKIGQDTLTDCRNVEEGPLFKYLGEHLPFKSLWADYEAWKEKHAQYIDLGENLLEDLVKEGETKMELRVRGCDYPGSRLTPEFEKPMVKRLGLTLAGEKPVAFHFSWQEATAQTGRAVMILCVDGENVIVVKTNGDKQKEYEKRYREVFDDCMQGDMMGRMKKLFNALCTLKDKIQRQLEEILVRRDYIRYSG
ncbi:MAG: hypothetical protein KAV98_02175, partial [Dehalococcoidia bacterium]|nr:hypothetical protein [Dehalococcoidia bacterium]